ncbi:MAG: dipeptidase [Evtepia sp.]
MKVFDGHCDTIYKCASGDAPLFSNPNGQWDLDRSLQFEGFAQFFALFSPQIENATQVCNLQYRFFQEQLKKNEPYVTLCRNAAQAQQAMSLGKTAAFLSLEGAELIDCNPKKLECAYTAGVRMINLTWNHANRLSGSAMQDPTRGLSEEGIAFVLKMEELGILVDVSHLSDPGFWDVVSISKNPIVASHSNARALCFHPRNLTDQQISAIIHSGGVIGLNFYTEFLGRRADLSTIAKHLKHIQKLGGEDHVALGSDFDGCDSLPKELSSGVLGLPNLYNCLEKQKFNELQKLFFTNLMRVVNDVCTM